MALPFIAVYGMGRFGRALAGALDTRKLPLVRVGGRSTAPAGWETLYVMGAARLLAGLDPGTLVVLAVPDDALQDVADEFAAQPGAAGLKFIHTSGARGPDALSVLATAGAQTGVFHILQSFPPQNGHALIPGSYGAVSGEIIPDLIELAGALDVTPIQLRDSQRVAYHAAAVLASNALVALLDVGRGILEEAGIAPEQASRMLIPLAKGTLANVQTLGLEAALTGPVVRGDLITIQLHLKGLQGSARATYVANMLACIELAERSGRTDPAKLSQIRELLTSQLG